jgi:hypothetical protein
MGVITHMKSQKFKEKTLLMIVRMKILVFQINPNVKMFSMTLIFMILFHQGSSLLIIQLKNEVLKTFKLNNLQLRASNNFIVDPLSTILQEQKQLCIHDISRIVKNEIIKAISEYFRKRNLHDIKFSTLITRVALLIYNPLLDKLVN